MLCAMLCIYVCLYQTSTCDDVDECSPSRCGDHTSCVNTAGGYTCTCLAGYTQGMGIDCVDIDECLSVGTCSGDANTVCVNQPGGHTCECQSGFNRIDGVCTGTHCRLSCDR